MQSSLPKSVCLVALSFTGLVLLRQAAVSRQRRQGEGFTKKPPLYLPMIPARISWRNVSETWYILSIKSDGSDDRNSFKDDPLNSKHS